MEINIPIKHNDGTWVDVDENQKFKLGYPTDIQQEKLKELATRFAWKKAKADECEDEIERSNLEASYIQDYILYQKLYIRYTIKDWEGFPMDCKLVNNALEENLWKGIVDNTKKPEQYADVFNLIDKHLSFTEDDKKKL